MNYLEKIVNKNIANKNYKYIYISYAVSDELRQKIKYYNEKYNQNIIYPCYTDYSICLEYCNEYYNNNLFRHNFAQINHEYLDDNLSNTSIQPFQVSLIEPKINQSINYKSFDLQRLDRYFKYPLHSLEDKSMIIPLPRNNYNKYCKNIGHRLIKSITVSIGGNIVDSRSPHCLSCSPCSYWNSSRRIFEIKKPYRIYHQICYLNKFINRNIINNIIKKIHKSCLIEVHDELIYAHNIKLDETCYD